MPQLPEKLPVGGKAWWARLANAFNQLRDYVASLQPIETPNAELEWTTIGVARRPKQTVQSEPNEPSNVHYRGAWSSIEKYVIGDIVVVPRYGRPTHGGLFICIKDAPAGSPQPVNPEVFPHDASSITFWDLLSGDIWDSYSISNEIGQKVDISAGGISIYGQTVAQNLAKNFQILMRATSQLDDDQYGPDGIVMLRTVSIDTPGGGHVEFEAICSPVRAYNSDGTQVG